METFKKSKCNYILVASLLIFFASCKEQPSTKNSAQDETLAIIDSFRIGDNLLESSNDFVSSNNISNANIEVDIDKKEFNQIYITFILRGMADFEVRKFKPLFTYQIKNNIFFVFTGAEELLKIPFNETRYENRRQGRYDTVLTAWYLFEDNKMRKEASPPFFEPFSNIPPPMPPPPLKKNSPKFDPSKFQPKH